MRLLPLAILAASLTLSTLASASPAAFACDRTRQEVAAAHVIVTAKATAVSTVEKDGTRYVRVAYAVDRTFKGKASGVIVVEEACTIGAPSLHEIGYPGVSNYCDVGSYHAMPGLDDKGQPDGNVVTLRLIDMKSNLDGRSLRRVVRISPWSRCPE